MSDIEDAKYAKSVSAKQIKKSLLKARGKAPPALPGEDLPGREWTQAMAVARDLAQKLWKAYITQDLEVFDEAVKQVGSNTLAIRLALEIAHQEFSPSTPSRLGSASAIRYAPIRASLLAAWSAAQAKGLKKSKNQFAKDWANQQQWTDGSIRPTLKTLIEWLPKGAAGK